MANDKRGEVELEIGGELRLLRLDSNAVYELEKSWDRPVSEIFDEDRMGFRQVLDGVFYGVKGAAPAKYRQLDRERVGRWLDEILQSEGQSGLIRVGQAVMKAILLWMGHDLDEIEKKTKEASEAAGFPKPATTTSTAPAVVSTGSPSNVTPPTSAGAPPASGEVPSGNS